MKFTTHPGFERRLVGVAAAGALLVLGTALARAQTPSSDAKASYDRELAQCNRVGVPNPAREACVRQAGLAFDRATGGVSGGQEATTADGRATLIVPLTGSPAATPAERSTDSTSPLTTTPDGRATVVRPAAP